MEKPSTLLGIVHLTGQRDSEDFPPRASSSQSAEASVPRDSSDSQLLKDNELDLLQSQSILQDSKEPLKESRKTRAHPPKGVILL